MFFNKILAKVFSFIGVIFGFTSEALPQYGAPVFFFTVKGKVKDIECNQPVKNANVKLINRRTGEEYKATTDSLGNFSILDEEPFPTDSFKMTISDSDKKENGLFKPTTTHIKAKNSIYDHYPLDTVQPDIYYIEYIKNSPCKDKPKPTPKKTPTQKILKPKNNTSIQKEDKNIPADKPNVKQFAKFNLSPNPNNGKFQITFHNETTETVEIKILDANNALVYAEDIFCQKGRNDINIEIRNIKQGTYRCLLRSSSAMSDKTFIVI